MGFFEGLDAEDYDRKYKDRDLLRRIFGLFQAAAKPHAGCIHLHPADFAGQRS